MFWDLWLESAVKTPTHTLLQNVENKTDLIGWIWDATCPASDSDVVSDVSGEVKIPQKTFMV